MLAVSITSCGSGEKETTSLLIGHYVGLGSVQNLEYKTPTQSGKTDINGSFKYLAGEIIIFSIGGLEITSTLAKENISPFDSIDGITTSNLSILAINQRVDKEQSLNRLSSILQIFDAFDTDNNPNNGISLPINLENLLSDIDINPSTFKKYKFINQLHAALNISVEENKLIKKPKISNEYTLISRLIKSLNLIISFKYQSKVLIDGPFKYQANYRYDNKGNMVLSEVDNNGDGTNDHTRSIAYNDSGDITAIISRDENGVPDYRITRTYDSYGNTVLEETDYDGDGNIDRTLRKVYDINNNRIRQESADGSGVVRSINIHEYDTNNNKIRSAFDGDANGLTDSIRISNYDVNNNIIRSEYDTNADGIIDEVDSYIYNEKGYVTIFEHSNGQGVIDYTREYTYDDLGNLLRELTNHDGITDDINEYTYDSENHLVTHERDSNGDGAVDYRESSLYDNEGYPVRLSIDTDGDGIFDSVLNQEFTSIEVYSNSFLSSLNVTDVLYRLLANQ